MASDLVQTMRSWCAQRCGSGDTIEAEQVIDKILQDIGVTESKKAGIAQFLKSFNGDLDARESAMAEAVRAVIDNHTNDKLPEYSLLEMEKERMSSIGEAQRNSLSMAEKDDDVVNASDAYIAAIRYHEVQKPKQAKPVSEDSEYNYVLASVWAAVSNGANYLTISYPPTSFINNVLRIPGLSRDEFHATVLDAMSQDIPFFVVCQQAAEKCSAEFNEMVEDYKNLFGSKKATVKNVEGVEEEVDVADLSAKDKAKHGLGSLAKSGLDMIGSVFGNHERHEKVLSETADKFTGISRDFGKKLGAKLIWIWRIVAAVDVISLLVRLGVLVLSFFVDVTGPKTEAVGGVLSKIPFVGGFFTKAATQVSATAIRSQLITKSIPIILALAFIAFMAITVWRRKETGKRDNVMQMLISMIVIVSTAASAYFLIKTGIALFTSRGEEYFWASFYSKI